MKRTLPTRNKSQAEQYAAAINRSRFGTAATFAKWLNQETPASRRIAESLNLLREALAVAQNASRKNTFGVGDKDREQFDELVERFNNQTSCYIGRMVWTGMFWPQDNHLLDRIRKREGCLRPTTEEIERVFLPPEPLTSFEAASGVDPDEWNGYLMLIHAMREKQIDNMRRCEVCGLWIFVRVPHGDRAQRRCPGGKCLKAWRKTSSAYKAEQAEYARKRRLDTRFKELRDAKRYAEEDLKHLLLLTANKQNQEKVNGIRSQIKKLNVKIAKVEERRRTHVDL